MGKVIDAVIVGLILFVTMSILGISFTPLIAVLMTVCNIIPVFGPIIGAVPSGIILLFANPLHALEFLILVIVVQQVDSNVLAPKILSRSLGISSFWVLFAVLLGANLFGVVGMVLGVPVFATLYGLMEEGGAVGAGPPRHRRGGRAHCPTRVRRRCRRAHPGG